MKQVQIEEAQDRRTLRLKIPCENPAYREKAKVGVATLASLQVPLSFPWKP